MTMKRAPVTVFLLAVILTALHAEGLFSNYDFTFYKTVSESLAIQDSSSLGLDYTGFGFIGESRTNGLFVRLGFQVPYSTLENVLYGEDATLDDDDFTLTTGQDADVFENEYRFTVLLGPALRYVWSASFDAYAGIGLKLEEDISMLASGRGGWSNNSYSTYLALDFDIGFKFNLEQNTSCRIGIYGTFELMSYTYSTTSINGDIQSDTDNVHLNIIASGNSRSPLEAVGYISLGKTFSSAMRPVYYRYETTSPVLGQGTLVEI